MNTIKRSIDFMEKTYYKFRKLLIIINLLALSFFSYSQKKITYFDLDNSLISEENYKNKLKESKSIFSLKEEDSVSIKNKLYYESIFFKLKQEDALDFRKNLETISGLKIENVDFIVITYVHKNNSISFSAENYRKRIAEGLNEKVNFFHFIIYENGYKSKKNRIIDTTNYFKKFCKISQQNFSSIFLSSKNEILIKRNDHHIYESIFKNWGN
jgi:hypothetical protein